MVEVGYLLIATAWTSDAAVCCFHRRRSSSCCSIRGMPMAQYET